MKCLLSALAALWFGTVTAVSDTSSWFGLNDSSPNSGSVDTGLEFAQAEQDTISTMKGALRSPAPLRSRMRVAFPFKKIESSPARARACAFAAERDRDDTKGEV